jgi:hypothetical protein
MAPIEKKFLRVKEIYNLLDGAVPESTLYYLIVHLKKMAYIRAGRAILVPREAYEEFVANGSCK